MNFLPVTITFISAYAIALTLLTAWIGLYRDKVNVLRGHGGETVLEKRSRFHGNLIENGPAMALVLGASESLGATEGFLWAAVASFVVGRVLYFQWYDMKIRGLAMSLTQFPAAFLALWCLYVIYAS